MTLNIFLVFESKWLQENEIVEEDPPVNDSVSIVHYIILFPYADNITIKVYNNCSSQCLFIAYYKHL